MKIIYQVVRDIEDLETSILVECTSIRVAQITHAVAVELFPSDSIDIVESDVAETDQEALDLLRLAYNKADLVEVLKKKRKKLLYLIHILAKYLNTKKILHLRPMKNLLDYLVVSPTKDAKTCMDML
jgi:hypothetical protein